ncbi:MAG TPA: M56 family metallopeptidase [Candidatus Binatus sp.]|nr:M56 family metallopeptidase [Candidatus Binatus sp.]
MHVWLQLGEAFARVSVSAIVNSLWEAIALTVLAWLTVRLVPRANASLRYGLWCVALAAVLILPVIALHAGATAPPAGGSADPAVAMPQRFAQFLFALWYVVATALVFRLILSYVRLQQIKANAEPLSPLYQHRVRRWLNATGGNRQCRLCVSDTVPMPVAIGLFDPVIVLPARLLDQLSDDELDQVGLHETAHLQRWDDYTNVFQKLVEALLFFNPAVYLIGRQLTLEREIACDDRVIAATGKPLTYAACLTRLVEATALTRQALPALAALTTRRQFAIRIERLLDGKRAGMPVASSLAAIAVCTALVVGLAAASRIAPLIAVAPEMSSTRIARAPAVATVATAAVRPTVFVIRQAVTAVHRIVTVARSNAVGARNIFVIHTREASVGVPTFVDKDVEIITAPAVHQALNDSPTVHSFVHSAPMHVLSPQLAMLDVRLKDMSAQLKPMSGKVKHLHEIMVTDGSSMVAVIPALPENDIAKASVSVAAAQAAAARVDAQVAAAEDAYSASAEETDNIPVLAARLPQLSPRYRIIAIRRLSDHLDSVEARSALVDEMLHDASLIVKLTAVKALGAHVDETDPQSALLRALSASDSPSVKVAIIGALSEAVTDTGVAHGLIVAFDVSQPESVQLAAAGALSNAVDDTDGQAALIAGLTSTSYSRVKSVIIRALSEVAREPAVRRALQAALGTDEPVSVQLAAVQALAPSADDPEIRAVLEQAGGTGCDVVRLSIKRALAQAGSQ